ncbi:MAG: Sec7 domain-containing protein [Roseimicrobium sp.]
MPFPEDPSVDDIARSPGMNRAFEEYRRKSGATISDEPSLDVVMATPELRQQFKHFATRSYGDTAFTSGGQPMQNEAGFDSYNAIEAIEGFRKMAASGASVQELHTMAQSMVNQRVDDDLRTGYHLDPSGRGLNISASIIGNTITKVDELGEVATGRSQEFRDAVTGYKQLVSSGADNQVLATRAKELYDTFVAPDAPKKVILPKAVEEGLSNIASFEPEEGIFTLDDDELRTKFNAADDVVAKRMSPGGIAATFDEMSKETRKLVISNDFNGAGVGASLGYLKSDQFKETLETAKQRLTLESLPGFKESPLFKAALNIDASHHAICDAFNQKPKDGIKLIKDLCGEQGLSDAETQQQIAAFLVSNKENLDLAGVGDYLSGPEPENQAVLKEFTGHLAPNMKGMEYTEALREYLGAFKLPGEAQKIDRLVNAFGNAYMQQNPKSGIANEDAAYVLSFQAIMLATDAHNPAVKNKMTFDQLKANLRGVNKGKDFSPELLENFYKDLTQTPLANTAKKVPTSIELDSEQLRTDRTLTKVTTELGKKAFNAEKALGIEGATAQVNQSKSLFGGLASHKSTVTITDKDGNQAILEMSKPGALSKDAPTVTIRPVGKPGEEPSPGSVKLAAQMAASFEAKATPVANFKYQRDEMAQQVQFLKTGVRVEQSELFQEQPTRARSTAVMPEEQTRARSRGVAQKPEPEKLEVEKLEPEKLELEKPALATPQLPTPAPDLGAKKETGVLIEEPKPKVELGISDRPMKVREQLQGSVARAKAQLAQQGLKDENPGGRKVGGGMK